ncbi:MAG: D-alanyl-D-alanine carboxypeptidase family protein [Bacillota bacterium]
MKKVALAMLATVISVAVVSLPGQALKGVPGITARAAVVIEAQSARVLMEKNGHQPRHPASLTKILTGIIALERGNPSDRVRASKRAAYTGGSTLKLRPGQEYRLEDLTSALLIMSANDAAVAIAEHLVGSVEGFAGAMNDKARSIGALHTHFLNPHGISRPGHMSTAYDIALMTRYALGIPGFARRVATKETDIWRLDQEIQVKLRNTNRLLWTYLGADGVKTGTTDLAGKCLAASATRGDMQLIVVVMNSQDRWSDAAALLEWGFENFEMVTPLNRGQPVGWVRVRGGLVPEVPAVLEEDLVAVIPRGQRGRLDMECHILETAWAPVGQGEPLGEVHLVLGEEIVASSLLVAHETVPRWTPFGALGRGLEPIARTFGLGTSSLGRKDVSPGRIDA